MPPATAAWNARIFPGPSQQCPATSGEFCSFNECEPQSMMVRSLESRRQQPSLRCLFQYLRWQSANRRRIILWKALRQNKSKRLEECTFLLQRQNASPIDDTSRRIYEAGMTRHTRCQTDAWTVQPQSRKHQKLHRSWHEGAR